MPPTQMRLQLDSSVRRYLNGANLLGGSPFRLVRLSGAGSAVLDRWLSGDEVAASSATDALRARLVRLGMVHPVPMGADPLRAVAFVIPVYDDADGLAQVLGCLRRDFPTQQILVVDDGSPDPDTIGEVCSGHGAEMIRHKTNCGPAAARNSGWCHVLGCPEQPDNVDHSADDSVDSPAHPEIIMFVDADVVPTLNSLQLVLAHFVDPQVQAVAPRVQAMPGHGRLDGYEAGNSPLDLGPDPGLVVASTRISYVPSAVLALRAELLESHGGFDEDMRFGEDVDLIWRLDDSGRVSATGQGASTRPTESRNINLEASGLAPIGGASGRIIRYEPKAVVHHRNRGSIVAFARQRYQYGSSAATLAKHHQHKVAPVQISPGLALSTVAMCVGRPLFRLAAAVAAVARVMRLRNTLQGKVDHPTKEAARFTAMVQGQAAGGLASALTRSWLPLMMFTRRGRRRALVALVAPALIDWLSARPSIDPVSFVALRGIDHAAYCSGVWAGVGRERSLAALLPYLRSSEPVGE